MLMLKKFTLATALVASPVALWGCSSGDDEPDGNGGGDDDQGGDGGQTDDSEAAKAIKAAIATDLYEDDEAPNDDVIDKTFDCVIADTKKGGKLYGKNVTDAEFDAAIANWKTTDQVPPEIASRLADLKDGKFPLSDKCTEADAKAYQDEQQKNALAAVGGYIQDQAPESATEKEKDEAVACVLRALNGQLTEQAVNTLLNEWVTADGLPKEVVKPTADCWSDFDPQADALEAVGAYITGEAAPVGATDTEKDEAVACVLDQLNRQLTEETVNTLLNEWVAEDGLPKDVVAPTAECWKKIAGMKKVGMETL